jgi:dCMP deaminase
MMDNYALRMFALADTIAEWSRNRGTHVGAVLFAGKGEAVMTTAVNKLPFGMDDDRPELHSGPLKGLVWEHAERGTIFAAARHGIKTHGLGMAVNWFPCAECARAIVEAGIAELIANEPDWTNEKWNASWLAAKDILESAKVRVTFVDRPEDATEEPKTGILIQFPQQEMLVRPPEDNPLQPIMA